MIYSVLAAASANAGPALFASGLSNFRKTNWGEQISESS